jgi:hypothetical protein
MIYYNSEIDYDYTVPGFTGDIFTEAGYLCTAYDDLMVPLNIEIGNTRFKYNYEDCEYVEVDRDNDEKSGSFVRTYEIDETIDVSRDTIISIVIFDEDSIERFIEVQNIPHTMKMLGVYSISFNLDRDDFRNDVINYYRDIAVYEQLMLKQQDNELAILEANGVSGNVNLLDLNALDEVTPLIVDFTVRYSDEIQAVEEMVEEISAITEEVTGTTND